jgi:hypothetical protein
MRTAMLARNLVWMIATLFGCVRYATPAQVPAPTREIPSQVPAPARPIPSHVPAPARPIPSQAPKHLWMLQKDAEPTIAANSEVLLFVHGMDSRAEEADDITKALFAALATGSAAPSAPASTPNPMGAVLNELLQKYKGCILEKYETQQDMVSRGLPANASGLTNINGLQPRDSVMCVAGNQCSLASRTTGFAVLQARANSGNAANFQKDLESIIPKDCFQCAKHAEEHTKHVHCTMEAGGNSGISSGPNGPIGPAFEGCKMGVDVEALARQVDQEIAGVIRGITNNPSMTSDVIGGASIATNHATIHFTSCPNPAKGCPEACDNPDTFLNGQRTAVVPQGYFGPMVPPGLLDTPPPRGSQINVPAAHNIGQNEGRLRLDLRAIAGQRNPVLSLCQSAAAFALGNVQDGNAFADLSVTGHHAFAAFRTQPPQYAQILACLQNDPRTKALPAATLQNAAEAALDRAYRVANFLRTGERGDTSALKAAKMKERNALGWIAVSGEDDSPHRPVNVPSSDFPQYDLLVPVEAPRAPADMPKVIQVRTRYTIAQSRSPLTGKNLVVISVDLPTSGYADNLDYHQVSALTDIGTPKLTPSPIPLPVPPGIEFLVPGMPAVIPPGTVIPPGVPLPDFQATGRTPLLDFIEAFVVHFAETLDQKVPIESNIKAVFGGSLGGNMTFRLGRRQGVPWLPKFVVWSPASIWTSLGAGADLFKHYGVRSAWESADRSRNTPADSDRKLFFGSWDKAIVPVIIPMAQSDTWTSDFYECKKSSVAGARLDRQETYDQHFLAWHWRLGGEQLLFSHSNTDPATQQPLYMLNQKPMLLGCGLEDHVPFNDICPATQSTASLMRMTPGKALFLDKTGHSLDNERRSFWAQQIIQFLGL